MGITERICDADRCSAGRLSADPCQMVVLEQADWLAWLELSRPEAELLQPLTSAASSGTGYEILAIPAEGGPNTIVWARQNGLHIPEHELPF